MLMAHFVPLFSLSYNPIKKIVHQSCRLVPKTFCWPLIFIICLWTLETAGYSEALRQLYLCCVSLVSGRGMPVEALASGKPDWSGSLLQIPHYCCGTALGDGERYFWSTHWENRHEEVKIFQIFFCRVEGRNMVVFLVLLCLAVRKFC